MINKKLIATLPLYHRWSRYFRPCSSCASFNFSILFAVWLLVIKIFLRNLSKFVSEYFIMIVISNKLDYNWTWCFSRLPWLADSMVSFYAVGCNIYIQILAYCFNNHPLLGPLTSRFHVREGSFCLSTAPAGQPVEFFLDWMFPIISFFFTHILWIYLK